MQKTTITIESGGQAQILVPMTAHEGSEGGLTWKLTADGLEAHGNKGRFLVQRLETSSISDPSKPVVLTLDGHTVDRYESVEKAKHVAAHLETMHEGKEAPASAGEAAAEDKCLPWVKVERDPDRYKSCMAANKKLGLIDSPRKVYELLAPALARSDQEVFLVLLQDVRMQLRGIAKVAKGQRSSVAIGIDDVMRVVLIDGAERFTVVHNHPTGKASPSDADKALTRTIKRASDPFSNVVFLDHVVIGIGEYYSFAEDKLVKVKDAPPARESKKKGKRR